MERTSQMNQCLRSSCVLKSSRTIAKCSWIGLSIDSLKMRAARKWRLKGWDWRACSVSYRQHESRRVSMLTLSTSPAIVEARCTPARLCDNNTRSNVRIPCYASYRKSRTSRRLSSRSSLRSTKHRGQERWVINPAAESTSLSVRSCSLHRRRQRGPSKCIKSRRIIPPSWHFSPWSYPSLRKLRPRRLKRSLRSMLKISGSAIWNSWRKSRRKLNS